MGGHKVQQGYQIRECTADACRLRFPADATQLPDLRCPSCGALTVIVFEAITGRREPSYASPAAKALRCDHDAHSPTDASSHLPRPFAIIVDNVRSLFNVGSIFRSADGAGITQLFLCGITPTPDNPKLAKTALGAEASVPWRYYKNSLDCLATLREAGYVLWALEETPTALSIFDVPLPAAPLALMVGNEVTGIDPMLLDDADAVVALPMYGTKRSLNVATASGVAAILLTQRLMTEANQSENAF